MCREVAGIELAASVTFAVIFTTQDARIYINENRPFADRVLDGAFHAKYTVIYCIIIFAQSKSSFKSYIFPEVKPTTTGRRTASGWFFTTRASSPLLNWTVESTG